MDENRIGDGPVEDEYLKVMEALARATDKVLNGDARGVDRENGFVLLGHKEGRCNYISNGVNRQDIVVMMKEQIARFEGQPEMSGNA